jgi:hypothetical protein
MKPYPRGQFCKSECSRPSWYTDRSPDPGLLTNVGMVVANAAYLDNRTLVTVSLGFYLFIGFEQE